jgi:hypothetical protein
LLAERPFQELGMADNPVPALSAEDEAALKQEAAKELRRERLKWQQKSPVEKASAVLTNSFVLWLLSSVVLALIAYLFAEYQKHAAEKTRQIQQSEATKAELRARLIAFENSIRFLQRELTNRKMDSQSPKPLYTRLGAAYSVAQRPTRPFYSEYANDSTLSLLRKLKGYSEQNKSTQQSITTCIEDWAEFRTWLIDDSSTVPWIKKEDHQVYQVYYRVVGGYMETILAKLEGEHFRAAIE